MAAADINSVRATIEGRLATELANSPAIPVVFHNMPYTPTPNSSWVQCLDDLWGKRILRAWPDDQWLQPDCWHTRHEHFFTQRRWPWCQPCDW